MAPWRRCTCGSEEVILIESGKDIHSTTHKKNTRTTTYNVPIKSTEYMYGTARNLPKNRIPLWCCLQPIDTQNT